MRISFLANIRGWQKPDPVLEIRIQAPAPPYFNVHLFLAILLAIYSSCQMFDESASEYRCSKEILLASIITTLRRHGDAIQEREQTPVESVVTIGLLHKSYDTSSAAGTQSKQSFPCQVYQRRAIPMDSTPKKAIMLEQYLMGKGKSL